MMKTFKLMCGFVALFAAVLISSCSSDPVISGGDGIPVADGFYITLSGVDPVVSQQLVSEVVEADGFATQEREGFYANYIFLTAGNYNVVNIIDQAISTTYGGTAVTAGTTGSDCDLQSYTLVEEATVDGAAFNIAATGFYKVIFDLETAEIIAYEIVKGQVIGAASPAGWSNAADQDMPLVGTATSTGVKFELVDVVLRPGDYKVRFNCRWIIDRRIDPAASPGHEANNGYVALTNFGGTFDLLVPGGPNFSIATGEDGKYKVTAEWTPADGFVLSSTKTTPLDPIVFNPEDYAWGIIGVGSPQGNWDADIPLTYAGVLANGHSWTGTFALNTAGGFKFRADPAWAFAPNANTYSAVTGDGAVDIDATGNDFMATVAGTHLITISTNDAGATWAIDFDKQ